MAWIAFVPFFYAVSRQKILARFFLGYFFGALFWAGLLYWLVHVTVLGSFVLVLYLALYNGLFAAMLFPASLENRRVRTILFIPAVWVCLEFIRSYVLTGFPWGLLGYSQTPNLPVLQIADTTGTWGISFIVMMVNGAIYQCIVYGPWVTEKKKRKYIAPSMAVAGVLLAGVVAYGIVRFQQIDGKKREAVNLVRVAVVQGNIPQELKWNEASQDYIMKRYIDLTHEAAGEMPSLIIWPEASLPTVIGEDPVYFSEVEKLAQNTGTWLLFGAVTLRHERYYNSAILMSPQKEVVDVYDKMHLVPFGEYIPLRKILPFLETVVPIGETTRGCSRTLFTFLPPGHTTPATFGVLICFEDLFPELSRELTKHGAGFLVNITNDAWYKKTPAAYQHFQASILRAVENRRFVVRATNTGVSGFIAPSGVVNAVLADKSGTSLFVGGMQARRIVPSQEKPTPYARFGEWFVVLCALVSIFGIGTRCNKERDLTLSAKHCGGSRCNP